MGRYIPTRAILFDFTIDFRKVYDFIHNTKDIISCGYNVFDNTKGQGDFELIKTVKKCSLILCFPPENKKGRFIH